MTQDGSRFTLDSAAVTELLDELDRRLRRRGVSAAVFLVGGAAIAASGVRNDRLTEDVDALFDDQAVLEEAAALGQARGLPSNWLNASARVWMPPLPDGALDRPDHPGLRVTFADDGFLLATKLIAQRVRDADDVVALAARLGMERATADELEEHIRRYYTDPDALQLIVDGDDVDAEVRYLAEAAANLLSQRRSKG